MSYFATQLPMQFDGLLGRLYAGNQDGDPMDAEDMQDVGFDQRMQDHRMRIGAMDDTRNAMMGDVNQRHGALMAELQNPRLNAGGLAGNAMIDENRQVNAEARGMPWWEAEGQRKSWFSGNAGPRSNDEWVAQQNRDGMNPNERFDANGLARNTPAGWDGNVSEITHDNNGFPIRRNGNEPLSAQAAKFNQLAQERYSRGVEAASNGNGRLVAPAASNASVVTDPLTGQEHVRITGAGQTSQERARLAQRAAMGLPADGGAVYRPSKSAVDISRIRAMAAANARSGMDPQTAMGMAVVNGQQLGDAGSDNPQANALLQSLLGYDPAQVDQNRMMALREQMAGVEMDKARTENALARKQLEAPREGSAEWAAERKNVELRQAQSLGADPDVRARADVELANSGQDLQADSPLVMGLKQDFAAGKDDDSVTGTYGTIQRKASFIRYAGAKGLSPQAAEKIWSNHIHPSWTRSFGDLHQDFIGDPVGKAIISPFTGGTK